MRANEFVQTLCDTRFEDVFNPYSDRCLAYDCADAPSRRRTALISILQAAEGAEVDSIWIGRDLGYRGGRRTGLALTDDIHLRTHADRWRIKYDRPTIGEPVVERTASAIWGILTNIQLPIFLWNVFPFHPHLPGQPLSNRSHSRAEGHFGQNVLAELVHRLRPRQIIALGNDAFQAARGFSTAYCDVVQVRHPSYGGQREFVAQIKGRYETQLEIRLV